MPGLYRLLIYLFPAPMWVVELIIRVAIGQGERAGEFFAPAVAGTALGMILPTVVPKLLAAERYQALLRRGIPAGIRFRSAWDEKVVPMGLMATFVGLGGWSVTLFLSLGGRFADDLQSWLDRTNAVTWIAGIMYLLAIVLTEFKERA